MGRLPNLWGKTLHLNFDPSVNLSPELVAQLIFVFPICKKMYDNDLCAAQRFC